MKKTDYYHRTVKLQISSDSASGGTKAKLSIPSRIRHEGEIEPGSFMTWQETTGMIRCTPAREVSLHTTTVFSSGTAQVCCGFPGVFWRKYTLKKGTAFHWEMRAGKAQGYLNVPKLPRRAICAKDKGLEKTHTVKILPLPRESRLRINIPAEFCRLLNLQPGHFIRWEELPGAIHCIPDWYQHMHTTRIVKREGCLQTEIPKLLGDKYTLRGKTCTWRLHKGNLVGTIKVRTK